MDLFRKYGRFILAALLLAGLFACKKEEEEETTPGSMSGTVVYDIPYYVLKGETVTMTASGIIHPKDVYYKWYVSGVYSDTLTANTITIRFPDSIGVFSVYAYSYADGYYSSSAMQQVTTIDTSWNSSLTGLSDSGRSFTDERDGRSYRYVSVGDLDWFSQNLAWQGAGVPFRASRATAGLFGSFYTWNEAMSSDVCPEGWRVPSETDWLSLAYELNGGQALPFVDNWAGLGAKASVDAYMNEARMWPYSPDNAHTNDVGWNALPLGYSFSNNAGKFEGLNAYGCWWSATEKNAGQAYYRYIWYDRSDFPVSYTDKDDLRAAVRCVRTRPQSL